MIIENDIQQALADQAINSKNISRLTAIEEITDQKLLERVFREVLHKYIKWRDNFDFDLAAEIGYDDPHHREAWETALEKITDQRVLADIAENDTVAEVRKAVIKNLNDQKALADIIKNDADSFVRIAAIEKVTDQKVLADVAKNEIIDSVREAAQAKLQANRWK
jgi:hypothetical protein